ncbi:hypothetical protein CLU83_0507 [Flavobacterium sp. 1]|uniref:hypothetical protein n=1 Tax=Flavobacterium sp. 1 TaxID=2035200 RepID=UPI000C23C50F|nr:hypothetical protein [Flavobacterium sp. 1]PJJ07344.1 hypothetical protein CLU83_0507 [Flavobacterium sp. 1]
MEFNWDVFKEGFIYMNDSSQHTVLTFLKDSINGTFRLENTFSKKKFRDSTNLKCSFDKAWLNAKFYVPYTGKKGGVYFKECEFGKDAELTAMSFDTIYFNRCIVNTPLYLEFDKTNNPVYLSFVNMDLDNIQFNFTKRVHLYFDSDLNKDYIVSTYERLLAKFKKEGKSESYKNVDIAYQKYIASQDGLKGRYSAFLNKYWWNYGYNKEYIIYWTFVFLFLFHFLNYLFWGKMQTVYTIIPLDDQLKLKEEGKLRFFLRTQLGIFLHTAYIFFSLKVDFGNLKYKYSRLLMLFFIQYITGLICLFFIANAILKL